MNSKCYLQPLSSAERSSSLVVMAVDQSAVKEITSLLISSIWRITGSIAPRSWEGPVPRIDLSMLEQLARQPSAPQQPTRLSQML